jgi:hypothetical protein
MASLREGLSRQHMLYGSVGGLVWSQQSEQGLSDCGNVVPQSFANFGQQNRPRRRIHADSAYSMSLNFGQYLHHISKHPAGLCSAKLSAGKQHQS